MPTKHLRVTVNIRPDELNHLRSQANPGESDSNLIRRLVRLKPLRHGGHRLPKEKK